MFEIIEYNFEKIVIFLLVLIAFQQYNFWKRQQDILNAISGRLFNTQAELNEMGKILLKPHYDKSIDKLKEGMKETSDTKLNISKYFDYLGLPAVLVQTDRKTYLGFYHEGDFWHSADAVVIGEFFGKYDEGESKEISQAEFTKKFGNVLDSLYLD